MFRVVKVDIPANTPETAPVTETIALRQGVITQWFVCFPDGVADHVRVVVYEHEHRILPRDEDESLFWNNYVFAIPEHWRLEDEPYEIEVRAWSEDDEFEQYVLLGVVVMPIEEVTLKDLFRAFLNTMVGEGAWG